jgi:hypothetical protein
MTNQIDRVQTEIVSGFSIIFDTLEAHAALTPAQLMSVKGKRYWWGFGLAWFVNMKLDPGFHPSRSKHSTLYKPFGVYLASLYELCRQADTGNAHGLFLECLADSLSGEAESQNSKARYVNQRRGSIQILRDEFTFEEEIPRSSPMHWLMQRSANEADRLPGWGRQYWYSGQRRKWRDNGTPFLNAWEKWLRHIERENGLGVASPHGETIAFPRRGKGNGYREVSPF